MTSELQNRLGETRGQTGAVILAGLAGASLWISLGTLAVTNAATMGRVAALPPWWLLVGLALSASALAFVIRLRVDRAWPLALAILLWLPYLPGEIPAAFLIWQGPAEGAVWCVLATAMLATGRWNWWALLRSGATDPERAPWLAGTALGVFALVSFNAVRAVVPNGDEPHYLVIAQSLLRDGDLQIENNHDRGDYLSYFAGRLRPDFMTRGADGQIYSIHAPGVSLLVLPAFAIAGYAGAVATIVLSSALASALTWRAAWLISASVGGAWVGWAAVFLTAPFLFHAFAIYPDGPAALCVIAGVWLLVRLESGRDVRVASIWAVSIALSLLPWFHTRFAIIAAALGVCLLLRLGQVPGRRARIVALLTVPVAAAAAWFGFFWMIWGVANPSAPYGTDTDASLAYVGRGLTGLLVDQQFGLLATAPAYVIAFAGALGLARRYPRLTTELAGACVPYVIATSAYAMWWGGFSAPARFLCALLPIAALPIASWWPRQSAATRTLALLLLMLSVLLVLPRAFVDQGRLLYSDRTGFDLVLDWASRSVDLPMAFPSVHRSSATGAISDALVWLAAGLLMAAVAYLLTRWPRQSAGATWTIVSLSGAVVAMLGCTIVWAKHGVAAVTADRSSVAALGAYAPSLQTTVLQLKPFRFLDAEAFVGRIEFGTTDRQDAAANAPARLRVDGLPAGDYALLSDGGRAANGEISVVVGRNDRAIERWQMAGRPAGVTGVVLHLPVTVASATLRADRADEATLPNLRLRALAVRPPANADGRRAVRAARYGPARVFFFDEQAYLEPTGFWTRVGGAATVVVDVDESARAEGVQLFLRAGAVATSIQASAGAWTRTWNLQAGQEEVVTLPAADHRSALALTLRSGGGFRPFAVDPASDDVRHLAVWVEIR